MKKILLALLFILLPFCFFAEPFGLKMGMTLDEITEASGGTKPKYRGDDSYFIYPEKKHSLFKTYVAFVDNEKGLYCIRAKTEKILLISIVESAFTEISGRISKTYGDPQAIDINAPGSYWEYMHWGEGSVLGGDLWAENLKDNLTCVTLYTTKSYNGEYYVILQFDFSNKKQVEDSQDMVF